MDSSNRTEGRSDNFHPRRLLLSGPPQVNSLYIFSVVQLSLMLGCVLTLFAYFLPLLGG